MIDDMTTIMDRLAAAWQCRVTDELLDAIQARATERRRIAARRQDTDITEANADVLVLLDVVSALRRQRDILLNDLEARMRATARNP